MKLHFKICVTCMVQHLEIYMYNLLEVDGESHSCLTLPVSFLKSHSICKA